MFHIDLSFCVTGFRCVLRVLPLISSYWLSVLPFPFPSPLPAFDYYFAIRLLRVLLHFFLLFGVVIVVLVSVGVDSIGLATRSRVAYAV